MTDLITDDPIEKVAQIIDSDAFLDPGVFTLEYGGFPSWSSESQPARKRRARNQARAALEAVVPAIVQAAKAEALRELRDYLTEPRRVWFGDLGVALDIGDPRSLLALSVSISTSAPTRSRGASRDHRLCRMVVDL